MARSSSRRVLWGLIVVGLLAFGAVSMAMFRTTQRMEDAEVCSESLVKTRGELASLRADLTAQKDAALAADSCASRLEGITASLDAANRRIDALQVRIASNNGGAGTAGGDTLPVVGKTLAPVVQTPITDGFASSTAVLIILCDRPDYLKRTLDQLMKLRPQRGFPVFASQDCLSSSKSSEIADLIKDYPSVTHLRHDEAYVPPNKPRENINYYKIARHYGWALGQIFDRFEYSQVIIVEDDLELAPDFFNYFAAALRVLRSDPTLFCASAWNDNGKEGFVSDPSRLLRSDFFPGLGWMMTRTLWLEIGGGWPEGYWDDWMREPDQRRGRACIRPEVSRTKTFGAKGSSGGQFYNEHLKFIQLNAVPVDFLSSDLSYLQKESYDANYMARVEAAVAIGGPGDVAGYSGADLVVEYNGLNGFRSAARGFKIMTDEKAGVPRTAYKGVVEFQKDGNTIFLKPVAGGATYALT